MKLRFADQRNAGFTFGKLLVVLVTVTIMFLVVSSGFALTKGTRNRCTGSLKQVALALNLWSQEHQNRFPMELFASEGGTREAALAGKLLPSVLIMSNELRTAAVLICPEDKKRKPAKTFASLTTDNVSYFLNVDVALTNQNHIIAGDRNLALDGSPVKPGLLEITNVNVLQWASWLHKGEGNVALVDGSAHQLTTKGLRDLLFLGRTTNRLIIP